MIEEQGKQLKNPENTYRSAPFWAFNGRLEEEELRRQIQEMKEQGMGDFLSIPGKGWKHLIFWKNGYNDEFK